jgi:hypothetical protein
MMARLPLTVNGLRLETMSPGKYSAFKSLAARNKVEDKFIVLTRLLQKKVIEACY